MSDLEAKPADCLTAPNRRARKTAGALLRERRSSVSLELASLAMPFLVVVLGTMELGYDLFAQQVMDYAVEAAARSVEVGIAQGWSGEKSSAFAAQAVCPATWGLLNCNNIVVAVAPVAAGTNYYTNTNVLTLANAGSQNGSICTGQAYQFMQIQAWYIGPSFAGNLIPAFATTYNGQLAHIAQAGAGWVNEPFAGGQSVGTGC
jgi:Flp pilus assembly protein TadG